MERDFSGDLVMGITWGLFLEPDKKKSYIEPDLHHEKLFNIVCK
jgi:hypothetical protein